MIPNSLVMDYFCVETRSTEKKMTENFTKNNKEGENLVQFL